jgi:hypothetical protein
MSNPATQFKPGNNANPNGRPLKGYSITEWFKGMLSSNPEIKDKLGKAILDKAQAGDPTAMKLVWNYMDGMPKQESEVTIKDITGLVSVE